MPILSCSPTRRRRWSISGSERTWSDLSGFGRLRPAWLPTEAKGAGTVAHRSWESALLGKRGRDPFLEDRRTLWLIHWNLSTNVQNPLLAWDYLLNRWQEPEFTPSTAIKALEKVACAQSDRVSRTTLEQHFDAFLHTYVPTRGPQGRGPGGQSRLPAGGVAADYVKTGDREIDRSSGKREPIYVFRREEKPDVSPELFVYCLDEFWQKRHLTRGKPCRSGRSHTATEAPDRCSSWQRMMFGRRIEGDD